MATNTTALASRYRVEVTEDLTLAGGWLKVFGLTDFKSSVAQNLVETSDYDNDGWESYEKTFQGWTAGLTIWVRTQSGVLTPSYTKLSAREVLFGDACRIGIRWYDKNGLPDAWQGVGVVQSERGNTGVKDPDQKTFNLQGDGPLAAITNPGSAATAPVVTAATPSAVAAGGQVQISGQGFTGTVATTGVKFGATNATSWVVVSDSLIVAIMPAGSAGAANIVVTNAVGPSTAFSYTRGA